MEVFNFTIAWLAYENGDQIRSTHSGNFYCKEDELCGHEEADTFSPAEIRGQWEVKK